MCFWLNCVQFLSLALFVIHFPQYCVQCASDSKQLSYEDLRSIEKGSEMLQLVHPVKNSIPLIFKHHIYTHISVDSSQNSNGHFPVLFLSLSKYSSWRRAKNSVRFCCVCAFWLQHVVPGVLKFERFWNCTPEWRILRALSWLWICCINTRTSAFVIFTKDWVNLLHCQLLAWHAHYLFFSRYYGSLWMCIIITPSLYELRALSTSGESIVL